MTEYVETAEAGGVVREYSNHLNPAHIAVAETLIGLLDAEAPEYLGGVLTTILSEIERRTNVALWRTVGDGLTVEDGGYSVGALASVFRDYPSLEIEFEPKRDLAGLISAVLKHPDTPADLYHAMRKELARLTESDAVNENPAVIAVALAAHKAEAEEERGE